MKKTLVIVLAFLLLLFPTTCYGISDSFSKVLELLEIPTKNVNGYLINETIYNQYQLIVYGSPLDVKEQRWKDVATGRWKNETTGKQGEYRVLGYSLTGTLVNNELFPDDYNSGKSPEEWNYIVIDDALNSWNDTEKYQTQEQMEYMLHQPLMRNGITYQLTAQSIGLDKARLEAYATWKTAGSIYTLKRDSAGTLWGATFHVPPMAADATLSATLSLRNGDTFYMEPEQEELIIPFSFGATITQLGDYAKVEDIKTISAEVTVNQVAFDKVIGEQQEAVQKQNRLVIRKRDYPNINQLVISVKNTAVLETRFYTEAPMVDVKEVTITVVLKEEEEEEKYITVRSENRQNKDDVPRPDITAIRLYRKSILALDQKASLWVAKQTNLPFICAGQILVVEATVTNQPTRVSFAIEGDASIQTLDGLTQRFVYEEPKERHEKMMYSSLNALQQSYQLPRSMKQENGKYQIEYIIPYQTKQTIHSWNTLRKITGNGFEIAEKDIMTRITSPYVIKIKASNEGGITTESCRLDVFERWDTIYNRDLSRYVK